MPPIISVVGRSKSGKTTLIEKLIFELNKRGYRIGTVKHAFHEFEIDRKGKDSWRHKKAGAETVIIASAGKIAMIKDEPYNTLNSIEKYFYDMDIVIAEGYKKENKPKIEVVRAEIANRPLCREENNLIALVTDTDTKLNIPTFGLEQIDKIADLIEKLYL